MARFTLPRDLYHGKGALESLKTLDGKKAIIVTGGSSMRRGGFLDQVLERLHLEDIDKGDILLLLILLFLFDQGEDEELLMALGLLFLL